MLKVNDNKSYWDLIYTPDLPPFKRSRIKQWILLEIALNLPNEKKYSDYGLFLLSEAPRIKRGIHPPNNKFILSMLRVIHINTKEEVNRRKKSKQNPLKKRNNPLDISKNYSLINKLITFNSKKEGIEKYKVNDPFFPKKKYALKSIQDACQDLVQRRLLIRNNDSISSKGGKRNEYTITATGLYVLIYLLIQEFIDNQKENGVTPLTKGQFALRFTGLFWFLWKNHVNTIKEARLIWKIIQTISNPFYIPFQTLLSEICSNFLDLCIQNVPKIITSKEDTSITRIQEIIWTDFFSHTIHTIISSEFDFKDFGPLFEDEVDFFSNPISELTAIIKDEISVDIKNYEIFMNIVSNTKKMLDNLNFFIEN
jgi:hypothetical protein